MWKHNETNKNKHISRPWCILMLIRELLSPRAHELLLRFYSLARISCVVTCVTQCRLKDQTAELGTFDGAVLALAPTTTTPTSRNQWEETIVSHVWNIFKCVLHVRFAPLRQFVKASCPNRLTIQILVDNKGLHRLLHVKANLLCRLPDPVACAEVRTRERTSTEQPEQSEQSAGALGERESDKGWYKNARHRWSGWRCLKSLTMWQHCYNTAYFESRIFMPQNFQMCKLFGSACLYLIPLFCISAPFKPICLRLHHFGALWRG
jgi:hypothetical protein